MGCVTVHKHAGAWNPNLKCVLNLDSLRPFQTEALLQGTDQLSIICLWVKNENH